MENGSCEDDFPIKYGELSVSMLVNRGFTLQKSNLSALNMTILWISCDLLDLLEGQQFGIGAPVACQFPVRKRIPVTTFC